MHTYTYRVYLDGAQYVDVQIQAPAPSTGQMMLESQYKGRRVQWMG